MNRLPLFACYILLCEIFVLSAVLMSIENALLIKLNIGFGVRNPVSNMMILSVFS